MSSFVNKNNYFDLQNYKYLTHRIKLSTKSSLEKHEQPKPKKININKFLTRTVYYEHKRNINLEKKIFEKILRERQYFKEKLCFTESSIRNNKLNKINPFIKKENEAKLLIKKKISDIKRSNTIEGTKIKNRSKIKNIKNKYKNTKLNKIQINKFCNNPKLNEKNKTIMIKIKNQDEKRNIGNLSQLINNNKNNHINKKAKYNHEKILYGLYKKKDLLDIKKTYLKNKYSYRFNPVINNNYKKITPRYNIIENNKRINSNSYNTLNHSKNNSNNVKIKYKSNEPKKKKHWKSLLKTILHLP